MASLGNKDFYVQFKDSVTSRAGKFAVTNSEVYEVYCYIYGEGKFFYFVNDSLIELIPGDIILTRPGILCGSYKKLTARYTRLIFRLSAEAVSLIGLLDKKLFNFISESDMSLIRPQKEISEKISAILNKVRVLLDSRCGNVLEAFSLFLRLIQTAVKNAGTVSVKNAVGNELISTVVDRINRDYASFSTVADVAAALNYSKNYLSQYFKKHMNIGLHDFLVGRKLAVAATMLVSGQSVTACAEACGFGSTAHFISLFKARYGVTPKKYQEKNH